MPSKDKSFLKYKLGRFYDSVDKDSNGKLEMKDWLSFREKAVKNMEEDSGTKWTPEQKKRLEKAHVRSFRTLTVFGLKAKSKEKWVNYMMTVRSLPGSKALARRNFRSVIEAMDVNNHGVVSRKDYYLRSASLLGLSEDEAKEIFAIIDTNGTGELSIEDFTEAHLHYFRDYEYNNYANVYGQISNPEE